jgi:hypothetical protein
MVVFSVTSKMAIHVATIWKQLPAAGCQFFAAVALEIRTGIPHSMPGRPRAGGETPSPQARAGYFKRVFRNK